ncbi:hypothetical protein [Salinarchaeum laminariae]|uniref:hypothetical protein n=1 Tax=Salinarchaeum laminariae TaxID=869888 RepID=UPI0020C10CC7|nr:hypothetical protein [Salinarchaeum laminariae]
MKRLDESVDPTDSHPMTRGVIRERLEHCRDAKVVLSGDGELTKISEAQASPFRAERRSKLASRVR